MTNSENKRLALNTGILYIKLILSIFIGLYTSRVILQVLGASDYGLYTIVGGIVSMMNFFGTTMVSVTYRHIVVEFGKGKEGNPNKIFNTVMVIHIGLVLFLVTLGETLGIYYIKNIANIDSSKINDAIFVLHMSMLATSLNILSIPYNGLIIAREKFIFTAIVEIGRSILQLILVITLTYYLGNRLRAYSTIVTLYSALLPICLFIYCRIKDKDIIRWSFNKKRTDYIQILQYAFWIMLGAVASIGQNQGSNMIINLFFNTIINAAFGIGFQINNYVMMFVQSLNQAAVPQIMKNQGGNKNARSLAIVYSISKYAFFIMLIPTIPLILNIDIVLKLWLNKAPTYTNIFAILLLIGGLIKCMGVGFDSYIQATGKIRTYQIFYSCAYLLVLPVSYFFYNIGAPAYTIIICTIAAVISILVFQLIYLSKISTFKIKEYIKHTTKPCLLVTFFSSPLIILKMLWSDNIYGFLGFSIMAIIWIIAMIGIFGLNKEEKSKIYSLINKKIKR